VSDTAAAPLPRPRLRRRGFAHELIETLFLIAAIYALVDLASVRFYVDGPSMEPSFFTGQRVIVSRASYLWGEPERGDIIVFESPDDPVADPPLIKRLIGLPGDTVEVRDTLVYVNGVALDEPYFVNAPCEPFNCPDNTWQLGPDQYFVMGDNRNRSRDSRRFGPVSRQHLIGEALVRYWPPADIGLIDHYKFTR
jgi:signal peptidase I